MSTHPQAKKLRAIAARLRALGAQPQQSNAELPFHAMALDEIAADLDEEARPRTAREREAEDGPLVRLARRVFG